tara:strand:+ start:646 stop:2088 length:1443 start_codon:yes stop_codon:yes gene_type:complete
MSICKRVIARLDIKGAKLIKGIRFEGVRVISNAYEAAKKYAECGIDEIFYSDAVASLYERNSLDELLKQTCQEVFVPITAGGAIRTVQDGRRLLLSGADKLAINSAAVKNPELINDLANAFGSQCVVVSIQARKSYSSSEWDVMIESGRERSDKNLISWINEVQSRGAGEIIVTSVDNDGIGEGTDHNLISKVEPFTNIPLIVGGGISSSNEITDIFKKHKKISGVSIGWGFHNSLIDVEDAHRAIKKADCAVKINNSTELDCFKNNIDVIIADYSMGNVESLINALEKIGIKPILSADKDKIYNADLLILPGVGAFPEGMKRLKEKNLCEPIKKRALKNKAIIGICLGMQLLFEESEEYKLSKGLGVIEGKITKLSSKNGDEFLPLPHIGWNKIIYNKDILDKDLDYFDSIYQYFVHSFGCIIKKNNPKDLLFSSIYGENNFISGVRKNNIIGFQFHPERSGKNGLDLLQKSIQSIIKR